ncbi:SIR2 family NAD-dependent protein deacylase [Xanthomonas sacchari]
MTMNLKNITEDISPENTILILGAGASIPSGAPSVADLINKISKQFGINANNLNLREIATLAETRKNRSELIHLIRSMISGIKAKGAILNIPHYPWKSIFSTNYDELLEDAYQRAKKNLHVISSNFDFTADAQLGSTKLFKIHGTINKDIVDGHVSRMIITEPDYDRTSEYRDALYDRLKADMNPGSNVLIIGQSLGDEDLRSLVQRAAAINQSVHQKGKISLLLYERDENRAQLFEARGIQVAFGGLDDFVATLGRRSTTHSVALDETSNPLDFITELRPVTVIASEETEISRANASAIFNGWPADYPDIEKGLTFERSISSEIINFFQDEEKLCAIVLGASGVGKTTAARQTLLKIMKNGYFCYEHKADIHFSPGHWLSVAQRLKSTNHVACLLIDDAHMHLYEINELVDRLVSENNFRLKIILASAKNHWGPRVKTPNIYSRGREFSMSRLDQAEIDKLLVLVESSPELRALVEAGFAGFSPSEKRRRLADRCNADMFVCLKNIFASEKFDDIVLREYAGLGRDSQEIYKLVAAMEHAGIHVHRQLIIRTLGIAGEAIPSTLINLDEIIKEYTINPKEGVYGWCVRHYVIATIISRYKFHDTQKRIDLFERVIDNISPTYEIEIRTVRDLCSIDTGIPSIPEKHTQNRLLRRLMSIAPGERVPRHRLIRNLIDLGEFEKAESEIRIFEKDFRKEAPIARYRVLLTIARAVYTPGLMDEDRIAILDQARELVLSAIERYDSNKYVLSSYCELGIESFKITGSHEIFDEAMKKLNLAEKKLGDPDITKLIIKYQRKISGHTVSAEFDE